MAMEAGVELVIASPEFEPAMAAIGMPCWIGDTSIDDNQPEIEPAQFPPQPATAAAAAVLYTSGTTGRPKAVALSEQNFLANMDGIKQATGFDDSHVMLAVLPLFHAYGLTVTTLLPLTEGASVVVPERFIPRQILQLIEKHRVSCLIAVPGQYRVLIKDPTPVDTSSFWLCVAGAERLPERLAQEFHERFELPAGAGLRHHRTVARGLLQSPLGQRSRLSRPSAAQSSRSPSAATTMKFFLRERSARSASAAPRSCSAT